ncbi:hypothetical protein F8568_017700 [Actinomadura sp. LD22]|uniref:Uncharacterized protein n=1 Tax=Actinomadura physcomitrii TaxID=2650748 RepID=A0A6I4MIW8_9ACTN|nr:hypothetical protein [Actinomadura physcomitrii]MWA02176.1 hypothetical protein [Actinomadura physcomitrii]
MATKTDPVQDARDALTAAQRARDEAAAELESFKDRILAGDDDVSPRDYGDAALAVEHAELKVQAAALTVQAAERDARHRTLAELRAEIITETGTADEALKEWQDVRDAVARLVARCHGRHRNIPRWQRDMHRNGVPERTPKTGPEPEHAGLGWARAGMGTGDSVFVDERRIQPIEPGMLIGSAAYAGARAAGVGYLRITPNQQIEDDPERWFRTRY